MARAQELLMALGAALLLSACAQTVPTPEIGPVAGTAVPEEARPAAYPAREAPTALPETRVPMPRAGTQNAFGLTVSPDLERAYDAYLAGDGRAALAALDAAEAAEPDAGPVMAFHLGAMRMRVLIMMGRAADAETLTPAVIADETAAFGFDLNALALRAEARLWLGDYPAAAADAKRVAAALRGWRLPTSYGGGPTNLAELYALTTAQLRAYTVLAGLHILQGDAAKALPWATAAERGFDAVHFVSSHPLYGLYLTPYADSYYGRAFNLLFLGAARALAAGDPAAGAGAFDRAAGYFDAVGYRAGAVAVAAIRAWTLYSLDRPEPALAAADRAVRAATAGGFPDFVWRVEALRGEMLIDARGPTAEAEAAFRRADAAIDLVSGALATDRAKRRYGVGKETVTYRLAGFDRRVGDLQRLFADLERGRARAFVDMLAGRSVAPGRQAALVAEIRRLDAEIRRLRVIRLAPGAPVEAGAETGDEASLVAARGAAVAKLRAVDPDLAAVHAAAAPDLAAVRAQLAPGAVLAYALPARPADRLAFLIATPDGARIHETGVTADGFRRLIVGFREAVATGREPAQERFAVRLAEAVELAEWRGADRTFVVPAGDLFFMPWGALPTAGPTVVLPTGGWLLRAPVAAGTAGAGVVGDPAFGGVLPQLDGARAEARAVARLLDTDPLIGAAATPAALRGRAPGDRFSVLHIASHGTFDARDPLRSTIALSDGNRAELLTAADLFADPLPAALVVLSACETGMGEAVAGDDFLGLARSFYLAGARTVVNSLWPVEDAGTKLFMERFHRAARGGADRAEAWAEAVAATRAAGHPPAVYGAFVLGGAG